MTPAERYAPIDFNQNPFVVIWEATRACNLACYHCRAAAQPRRNRFELTTYEGYKLIDQIALMKPKVFVITGGDPLKRDDVFQFVDYARRRGLEPSFTPSATPLLTDEAVHRLKANGLGRIAVSLDGSTAAIHDQFRGVSGSFDLTMRAIETAVADCIPVQVNTTISRRNIDDMPAMAKLLQDLGIVMWSVFYLVPTGRAKTPDLITPEEVEQTFELLWQTSQTAPFAIRTTEAMHYRRYQLVKRMEQQGRTMDELLDPETGMIDPSMLFVSEGRPLPLGVQWGAVQRAPRGVNEAKGFVFISHIGDVYPSGFLPLKAGNVRDQSLVSIYRRSDLFTALRDTNNLKGKCGACEFRDLCGGSRARAYAMFGDVHASDPLCLYQPKSMLKAS